MNIFQIVEDSFTERDPMDIDDTRFIIQWYFVPEEIALLISNTRDLAPVQIDGSPRGVFAPCEADSISLSFQQFHFRLSYRIIFWNLRRIEKVIEMKLFLKTGTGC